MLLGLHCPVAGGFVEALERAASLGCEAIQILPYRRHRDPASEDAEGFRRALEKSAVKRVLLHSRFVPSLASSDDARRARSVELLAAELALAPSWGADAFVLHAGAYSPGAAAGEGVELAARSIAEAARRAACGATICVENVPGGGRRLGGTLEELRDLLSALRLSGVRAAACLDTAHAWASGYEIGSAEGMLKFLSKAHRLLGDFGVAAFHLNDTRALLGSHREHHWHWGQGYLGAEGLRVLLARPEYRETAGILETPAGPRDAENLAFARSLRSAVL